LYLVQVKQMLKRQRQSSKLTNEQIKKKLTENGFFKDDLSKNAPVYTIHSHILSMKISFSIDIMSTKTNIIFSSYNS